jgi:hypothetical protein
VPDGGEDKGLCRLSPDSTDEIEAYPISTLVNSPKNDVPAFIEASA